MVTLLAFMANVCDIARALQEEVVESRRERFLLADAESTTTSTTAAVVDDGEDEKGDGPNTRIAKAVEVSVLWVCVCNMYCSYTHKLQIITHYNDANMWIV